MQRIHEAMRNIHPSMFEFLLKNQGVGEYPQKTAYELFRLIKTHSYKKSLNPSSKIDYYAKLRVLCIDEPGYTYHKKEDTDIIFQIIIVRKERR